MLDALTQVVSLSERAKIDKCLRDTGFASFPIIFQGENASQCDEAASALLGHPVKIGPGFAVPSATFAVRLESMKK